MEILDTRYINMLEIKNKLLEMSSTINKYCVGMEGNISAKQDNYILIKASGSKLSSLKEEDLILFDFNGNQISNFNKKGSMELGFHTFLLGFKDINFISHTHPVNTIKILCTNYSEIFANNRLFPDQVIFNGLKSCLVPYAKPGDDLTEKIKENVNLFFEKE
jgi:ribulose-5-phosphate 4-epimerase/fuculose-1-phosphate aldolase